MAAVGTPTGRISSDGLGRDYDLALALTVDGVAAGYKVARGTGTLDGSNPTNVATGLTTVAAFVATIIDTDGVGSGTAFLTHGAPSGGTVPVYAWVVAGTASTGTETFSWIAVGT